MCLSSFGFTRILYQQNFEGVETPEEAGWAYMGDKAVASIASDGEGKYLDLNNNGANGRSAMCSWGSDIYLNADGTSVLEDGIYTMSFEFSFNTFSNNQYDGCIDVFTNHAPNVANQAYRMPWTSKGDGGVWDNFILDMTQDNAAKSPDSFFVNAPTVKSETTNEETGDVTVTYSIAEENLFTLVKGDWYSVTLTVDTEARTVEYLIENMSNQDNAISGTREVPSIDPDGTDISMFAEGMFIKTARYVADMYIDNIMITCESKNAFAGAPTVALTRIGWTGSEADPEENLSARGYKISFGIGETLHFVGTDGKEQVYDWYDCDGTLEYETTNSGVLKAWTTCDDATSEVIEVVVNCDPIPLPSASANITCVEAGYGKIYSLAVDNADVPLRPQIVMSYKYEGIDGEMLEGNGLFSGDLITVSQAGTLTVTTHSFGYQPTTAKIQNDSEFAAKKEYDFARMTEDQLKEAGFPAFTVLNTSNTKGFDCWSGRKRLYYRLEGSETVNEEGETVWTNVLPFGFVAEDSENVVNYTVINNVDKAGAPDSEEAQANAANTNNVKDEVFKGLTIFPKTSKNSPWQDPYGATQEDKDKKHYGTPNVGIIYRVGLFNDQTINNNNNVIVHDLEEKDFVVFNYISDYGSNSVHPICATDVEYYEQLGGSNVVYAAALDGVLNEETNLYDVTYPLYRIDTALTKISIFSQVSGGDAVESVEAVKAVDNYWYSIDGMRLAQPTRPGLYIHNGKKIIVK